MVGKLRGDLGQPDGRFHGFDLTKEWARAAEFVVPPMLEQSGGFGCDAPIGGVGQRAPLVHFLPHGIDDGLVDVLLLLR